ASSSRSHDAVSPGSNVAAASSCVSARRLRPRESRRREKRPARWSAVSSSGRPSPSSSPQLRATAANVSRAARTLPAVKAPVDPVSSAGFARGAEVYDRARPEYPDRTVDWAVERLGLRSGSVVVDLAAGTGKLTRAFVARGLNAVAVDPSSEMLAQLR